LTVDPAAAVPMTFGVLLFAGDAGVTEVIDGVEGGLWLSVYAKPAEHAEAPPVSKAMA